jgi:pyruvate formate lyase activating enzyme
MEWRAADFQRPDGDVVECTLCPFACRLHDGDTGRCRVRRRRGDALETATFATAVRHLHAVERKPLYHWRPGSRVLTLAPPGCTFACRYCQNFRISQYGRSEEAPWSAAPFDPAEILAEARAAGAAVAFSYSEPALAAEATIALAGGGADVIWKTNGFVTPAAARRVGAVLSAANVDLKDVDDARHRRLTGAPVTPVLAALDALAAAGVWLEVSTPLIPGWNDDPATLRALAEAVRALGPETPWHLLRFHPDYRLQGAPPTPPALLERARAVAREAGLRHVYVERALGEDGRATRCPRCDEVVVRRDLWALAGSMLVDGRCPRCTTRVAGRWQEAPCPRSDS